MDEVPAWTPAWRRERMERQGERGREQGPSSCDGNRGGARLRHGIGPQLKFRTGTEHGRRPLNSNGGGEVNKENKEEGRINSPPVDLKPVIWVMICLLKQLGDLTMDEMKRKTTLVWRTTPTTYSWWTKYTWILIILMIGVFGGVHSAPGLGGVRSAPGHEFGVHHRFTAYDCEHPTAVQALRLPMYCITQKTTDDATNQTTDLTMTDKDPYQLLQKATYHEFEAHQCIQTRSRFFYSCVWASHSVLNVVPETGRHIVTSIDFCTQAVKTNTYVTVAGASVALKSDGRPTYIVETIAGDLNVAGTGHVSCNGEDVRHHGRTLKQTVILQETHFTIKTVKIRKNFDSRELMIVETGTTIPNLTTPGRFSIDTSPHERPSPHPHSWMLNPPSRCPIQGTYRKTGHPNIVVFQQPEGPVSAEPCASVNTKYGNSESGVGDLQDLKEIWISP